MDKLKREIVTTLTGMAICIALLAGLWFYYFSPSLSPVWIDQGKITSITQSSDNFVSDWHFVVVTNSHGTVSPVISHCNVELVGNTIYVSMLSNGVYAQTDSTGDIFGYCTR